ncbi:hypothetical protein GOODEAATRI_033369 [Goodea atripinnis]|uniref:Uncharacterized protein n=1 Tax=Goodea atripinnis TaxID=208336 RepID=A0ABV0NI52_9TELE
MIFRFPAPFTLCPPGSPPLLHPRTRGPLRVTQEHYGAWRSASFGTTRSVKDRCLPGRMNLCAQYLRLGMATVHWRNLLEE